MPAPMFAFSLDRFTVQTDQNIAVQLPQSRMAPVKRPSGPMGQQRMADLAELLEGQREIRCPPMSYNHMYVKASKTLSCMTRHGKTPGAKEDETGLWSPATEVLTSTRFLHLMPEWHQSLGMADIGSSSACRNT